MAYSAGEQQSGAGTTNTQQVPENRSSFAWGRIIAWTVVIVLSVLTLFPFYWALRTALSTQRDLLSDPATFLPANLTWDNFRAVLGIEGGTGRTFNFWHYLRNTVLVSTIVSVSQILFSSMAAFSLARLNFPGRDKIFLLFLSALMIPAIVLMIPNFVLIYDLGWINTFQGIIAPRFFMTPFAIFFLRQFFLGVNRDLEEVAYLDGAGFFEVYRRIVMPLNQGPLLTLGIIVFVTEWNEYLWPFLVGRGEDVRVLTVALSVFRSQTPAGSPDWPGLMAGTLLAALPIMLIFIVAGRRIATSIQFTGVK